MTMGGNISEGEFERTLTALREDIRSGFAGVNHRLDILNGQTRKHGEAISAHDQRFVGIDREVKNMGADVKSLNERPKLRTTKRGALVPDGMSNAKVAGYVGGGIGALAVAQALLQTVLNFGYEKLAPLLHLPGAAQ